MYFSDCCIVSLCGCVFCPHHAYVYRWLVWSLARWLACVIIMHMYVLSVCVFLRMRRRVLWYFSCAYFCYLTNDALWQMSADSTQNSMLYVLLLITRAQLTSRQTRQHGCTGLFSLGGWAIFSRKKIFRQCPPPQKKTAVLTCKITLCPTPRRIVISEQDSWAIAKKTTRCTQYMGALKSFQSPRYAPSYFSRNL